MLTRRLNVAANQGGAPRGWAGQAQVVVPAVPFADFPIGSAQCLGWPGTPGAGKPIRPSGSEHRAQVVALVRVSDLVGGGELLVCLGWVATHSRQPPEVSVGVIGSLHVPDRLGASKGFSGSC